MTLREEIEKIINTTPKHDDDYHRMYNVGEVTDQICQLVKERLEKMGENNERGEG